jgi:hypothetical protein
MTVTPSLQNDVVPTIELTKRWSASRLKTWSACPLQGHYKYDCLLKEPQGSKASYGSCLHAALHEYNQGASIETAVAIFEELWRNPEKIGLAIDVWNKGSTFGGLLEHGVEVLRRYHDSLKWDERDVICSEHPFLVPFGDYELTGYVDLLELRKSGNGRRSLRVIDYKGGSWQPRTAELLLDMQFTSYLWAVDQIEFWTGNGTPEFPAIENGEELYEELLNVPRRAIWYHLNGPKEVDAGKRGDEDFARMYRLMREINRAEAAQVFVPRIGDACGLCGFTKECGIPVLVKDDADEDRWL